MKIPVVEGNYRIALPVHWGDETLTIWFNPSRRTVGLYQRLVDLNLTRQYLAWFEALFSLLDDWDLEEDDGTKVPIDSDSIAQLPMDFATEIAKAVTDELDRQNLIVKLPHTGDKDNTDLPNR